LAFGEICLGIEMALIEVRYCAFGFVVLKIFQHDYLDELHGWKRIKSLEDSK
jgi:hypothetical protein